MKLKNKYILLPLIVIAVIMLDLVTKILFGDISYTEIIPYLINFETNHGNTGAAWGILSGELWLLIIISLLFIGIMITLDLVFKRKSALYTIAFSFILGGAVGNLIDRIFLGYVRDFINFTFLPSFPTFNLADSFLCMGVTLMCVYLIFFDSKSTKKVKDDN